MHAPNIELSQRAPAGAGRLRFRRNPGANRTAAVEAFAASPLKLVLPRNHGSAAWAVTSTYGGGLLGGDTIALDVSVEAGAQAVLLSQASTKVYRSELPARQVLVARVEHGGLLVSAPDRVACFAGSTLRQTQCFELEAGANLVALDWISAGRLESGERWVFEQCSSRIEIRRTGKLVFLDALLLDARQGSLAARLRRYNTLATLVFSGPLLAAGSAALQARIAQAAPGAENGVLEGASFFGADVGEPEGLVLRYAAQDVETLGQSLKSALQFVADLLGDDPWTRRW